MREMLGDQIFVRQCIERAFGILVKRWGILWRPLQCSFDRWNLVLSVCAKLHNRCIDEAIMTEDRIETCPDDYDYNDTEEVHTNDDQIEEENVEDQFIHGRAVEENERRNNLVTRMETNGWPGRRPAEYANSNSKST